MGGAQRCDMALLLQAEVLYIRKERERHASRDSCRPERDAITKDGQVSHSHEGLGLWEVAAALFMTPFFSAARPDCSVAVISEEAGISLLPEANCFRSSYCSFGGPGGTSRRRTSRLPRTARHGAPVASSRRSLVRYRNNWGGWTPAHSARREK